MEDMEGRVKGREANLNNARNLKKMGVAIDVISQATGLSKHGVGFNKKNRPVLRREQAGSIT